MHELHTIGKDRTGLLSMLLLHLRGATEEEILHDYSLSRYAYGDLNDKSATVASLKQADLDLQLFFDAPIDAMRHAMHFLESRYGSIENYVRKYGFDDLWIEKIRSF